MSNYINQVSDSLKNHIEDMKTIAFLHMQLKRDGNSLYVSNIKILMELHLG